jgi:hypothetical protein
MLDLECQKAGFSCWGDGCGTCQPGSRIQTAMGATMQQCNNAQASETGSFEVSYRQIYAAVVDLCCQL